MLTILTVLDSYSDDTFLKVGTKEGGWFYIGGVGDYKKRYKEIDKIVKKYDESLTNRALKSLLYSAHNPPAAIKDKELWEEELEAYFSNLEVKAQLYEKHAAVLNSYIDISARPVADFFKADPVIKENCLNIVVEGGERGRYWDHTDSDFGSVSLLSSV